MTPHQKSPSGTLRSTNSVVALIPICVSAVLSACSKQPSQSFAEQALQEKITRESDNRIQLVRFRKTNGQSAEVMGVKVYNLEYEAEIEFWEPCKWNIGGLAGVLPNSTLSFRTSAPSDSSWSATAQLMEAATNPGTEMSKGARVKLAGTIRFEKKEKGWWLDGVTVTLLALSAGNSANMEGTRTSGMVSSSGARSPAKASKLQMPRDLLEDGFRRNLKLPVFGNAEVKVISFTKVREDTNTFPRGYLVDFESEIEFEKDAVFCGVPIHAGDRLKVANTIEGAFSIVDDFRFLGASKDSLLSQLRNTQAKKADGIQTATCIANLRMMDGAKTTWALENRKVDNAAPNDSDLFGPTSYIREKPTCPAGGVYSLNAVNQLPSCSISEHRLSR